MSQHQHGPNCRHGHGHGGQHGHQGMNFPGQQQQVSPDDYFKDLKKKYNDNRIFFWQQILMGAALDKFYEKYGLSFMRMFSCQTPMMMIGSIEAAANFECIPKQLKHITSGLFFPILFLLFFNFNVVVGIGHDNLLLRGMIWATMIFFTLAGLRGSGELNNSETKERSQYIYSIRPYLQNPNSSCNACGIVRFFRSMHCPYCKSCVTKHTRHSIAFGACIGAANELFSLLFFTLFWATQLLILYTFYSTNTYGIITNIMFYAMNGSLCWISFTDAATLFVLNIYYGVTEQELRTWPMQQYLLKVPEREFQNNVGQGFLNNLIGSISAAFGIPGFESQNHELPSVLAFPPIDPEKTYRINWAKAYIYLAPFLPTHKNRQQIQQLLLREQPKIIQMYKLQKKFKEEVLLQAGSVTLNEFQIQQKVGMKMQAHMMKNMPQMMMQNQPSQDQQRAIQLQMLSHMKKQFAAEADLATQIQELHNQLSQSQLTPIEANMKMRQLQQELMQRRMSKVMKQQQSKKKREEDQEAPMARVADEDL